MQAFGLSNGLFLGVVRFNPEVAFFCAQMCRICEEEVESKQLEEHTSYCAIAEKYDQSSDPTKVRIRKMVEGLCERNNLVEKVCGRAVAFLTGGGSGAESEEVDSRQFFYKDKRCCILVSKAIVEQAPYSA